MNMATGLAGMDERGFASEAVLQAMKVSPVAGLAAWTMNDVLTAVGIVLGVYQIAYLTWKWRREARGKSRA